MSVVIVCLPNAPKVSEEAVRKDTELNSYLESRVEGESGRMEKNNVLFNVFIQRINCLCVNEFYT